MAAPPPEIDKALERKLAARAADGDTAAVADLYDAYEQRLYGYCHRICRHPEDAADATQEAFCNVIQRLPGLDVTTLNFAAYLFTAARNACMDIISQRGRAEVTDEVPEDPFAAPDISTDPERAILTKDQQRAAREASDRLPESQRSVLALREVAGLSYDEIAESMEMNSNAVAQLISRARLNFHKQLRTGSVVIPPLDDAAQRAIELTVKRQDGKINSDDLDWLNTHLAENEASRVNAEAIQESAVLYRAIGPVAVVASLREAAMARASTIAEQNAKGDGGPGAQASQSSSTTPGGPAVANATTPPTAGASDSTAEEHRTARRTSRRIAGVAGLVLVFTLILAGVTSDKATTPVSPTAETLKQAPPADKSEDVAKPKESETEPTEQRSSQAPGQQIYNNNESAASDREKRKERVSKDKPVDRPAADEPAVDQPPPASTPPAEEPADPPPPSKPPSGPGSICLPPYCTTPKPG